MIDETDLSIDPRSTTEILTRFIATELHRTGLRKLVLGVSGGIDSAVSAALAVRAIGAGNVHGLMMPYRSSAASSLDDAESLVRQLEMPHEVAEITAMVDGFDSVSGKVEPNRLGNVMARMRMILLYDRSAALGALVLGTSNKTELLLGYGTLFGDMASAFNPIGDLYKTQIFALADYLEIPAAIRTKTPSADLWPGQTDESEMGLTYAEVDRILALLVDARIDRDGIVNAGFDAATVDRVGSMVVRSQFKRRMPAIAKVSTRTIGWDFRYPRDWNS